MSISLLATVELQLIMHCCDFKCLLSLARCSRFTLACANTAFAFRHMPPFSVSLHESALSRKLSASLFRHVSIATSVKNVSLGSRDNVSELEMDQIKSLQFVPNFHVLTPSCCNFTWDQWRELLSHPCCQQLRILRMERTYDDSVPDLAAAHLKHLHTLHIQSSDAAIPRSYFIALPQILSLTSLTIHASCSLDSGIASIGDCAALHHLHLSVLGSEAFHDVLCHTGMRHLRTLHLETVCAAHRNGLGKPPASFGWSDIFAPMVHLECLTLCRIFSIDLVLEALVANGPSVLRSLTLLAQYKEDLSIAEAFATRGSLLPSEQVLQRLLRLTPLLALHVRLPGANAFVKRLKQEEGWKQMHFPGLQKIFGKRVDVQITA
jgi:hypothetical protein